MMNKIKQETMKKEKIRQEMMNKIKQETMKKE